MTHSSHDTFIDRRSIEEVNAGLCTPILCWYDEDKKGRRRTNGLAISWDLRLLVARSVCSKSDRFVKYHGRMVVRNRLIGQAQKHNWELSIPGFDNKSTNLDALPDAAAKQYQEAFGKDDITGRKRAYNAARLAARFKQHMTDKAELLLDDFENGRP